MAKSEIIVGLDVGTTKACAVVGELTKQGIELVGHGMAPCQGLKKGTVVDIEATVAAIESAIEAAQRATGFHIREVAVGVTGEHIESVNGRAALAIHRLREVTEEDVDQALDAAQRVSLSSGREIIHNIPRMFTVDGQQGIRRPVGMAGTSLEVETHVVTAQTSFIQNVVKCVHQAGLSITTGGIILEPLATAETVLHADEKELGVALVDIGGGTSDMVLVRMGTAFHSTVVPVGGNHVTNDLAVGLRVAQAEAERIKRAHGTALEETVGEMEAVTVTPVGRDGGEPLQIPRKLLVEIIQPRMEELFEMVQERIAAAGALDLLPAGLVLSGGGSLLPGTLEIASRVLEMPVRLGAPVDPAAATGPLRGPEFATAVGLVLYAARHHRAEGRDGRLLGPVLGRITRWVRRLFS